MIEDDKIDIEITKEEILNIENNRNAYTEKKGMTEEYMLKKERDLERET